jgi:hypothetical protein
MTGICTRTCYLLANTHHMSSSNHNPVAESCHESGMMNQDAVAHQLGGESWSVAGTVSW